MSKDCTVDIIHFAALEHKNEKQSSPWPYEA